MKQLNQVLAIIGVTSMLSTAAVFSQNLLTVDELGHGTFVTNSLPPAVIAVEPFSGIATLRYTLPFLGTAGDVVLLDTVGGIVSTNDLLRFDGQGHLFFFSDREPNDPNPDPADVGVPPVSGFQAVFIQEVGPEGNNGATYLPGPGGPGADPANPIYHFISDVPEPGALALSTVGGILLLVLRARCIAKRH